MESSTPIENRRFMNVFLLAMLNMAVMASIRGLPLIAEYGLGALFLYFLVAIAFLFPAALTSAELATGWTRTGGVYIWVREAFGPKWGFFAIWIQWVHNMTWFPAILAFVATIVGYLFNPNLVENKFYLLSVILGGFWLMTVFNYYGLKISSWFSALGVIFGTILPALFLIALGLYWFGSGEPLQISFAMKDLIPNLSRPSNLAFLAGMFLGFGGLEVSAVHAREVQNPQKNYPRAILIAAVLTLVLFTLGSLSIAITLPKEDISLVAGVMQTFELILNNIGIGFLSPFIALLIIFGAVGELNAWIIGPVRGLYATAKHGDLPPFFQQLNSRGIPSHLLLFQALTVTLVSLVIFFVPTASAAFWILSALTAQIYLIMYIVMFAAAIRLRYSHPHVERQYRIPYKKKGVWIVAGTGVVSSVFALIISFFPPSQINVGNIYFYESFLMIGIVIMCAIPLFIYKHRKPSWHPKD